MPQYEYICEDDGEVITLLRAMKDADAPVEDPREMGRRFVRKHSTFGVAGAVASTSSASLPGPHRHGGGCACGNPHGPCGSR